MKQQITMNWDKMQANGNARKGRKGSKFVSRLTGKDANGLRPSLVGKVRGLSFAETCKLEKTTDIPVNQAKDGTFYYQARIGGKFGKRLAISESLARKLA
jgi:hypothetical protein